ncbi:15717_t:CDS:2 [Entrophospora sp. SA101]|nr:15717_t:CDS:2 [Entrophospora sp. SA101]
MSKCYHGKAFLVYKTNILHPYPSKYLKDTQNNFEEWDGVIYQEPFEQQ